MTGSGKKRLLGPHLRLTESQSGRGKSPRNLHFKTSFIPVIVLLIKSENHYNRISLKTEKPLYLKPLWGNLPTPAPICKSLSPDTLKFLAHLFPGYISWPQSLCLHFWEGLDHQNSTDSPPFPSLKSSVGPPNCPLGKTELLISIY